MDDVADTVLLIETKLLGEWVPPDRGTNHGYALWASGLIMVGPIQSLVAFRNDYGGSTLHTHPVFRRTEHAWAWKHYGHALHPDDVA